MHNAFGRPHRHRTLLHHNFITLRCVGNHACRTFHILQIGRTATPVAERLCWRIHRNEDQFGFFYGSLNVIAEKQINISAFFHNIVESGLYAER